MRQMAVESTSSESAAAEASQFSGDTQMGPVHPVDATDLYGTGQAPNDVRYAQAPREGEAWAFPVQQAHMVMGQMTAGTDVHTVAAGPFDGPYDAATTQPGVPLYGMAGGAS